MRRPGADLPFCVGWAVLPLAFAEGFGNTYTEPKLTVLLALALGCLASLVWRGAPPRLGAFAAGTALLLLWRLAGAAQAQNPGTLLQAVALDACALAIALFVARSSLTAERLSAWLVPTTALLLAGVLPMILFRKVVVSAASPFGSTIGWKNSLSVFLAQIVPLLLVLLLRAPRERLAARTAALVALLSPLFWVVLSSRTRSAWWMVLLTFAGVALFAVRLRERAWWWTLGALACSLLAGTLLLAFVPNQLQWRTPSPYLDSLSTMASPARSNGRVEIWRVGLAMIADAPVLGVGTGNYPVLARDWIERTDVDPKRFAFQRADLPAFNDYLQDAIENGLPGGMLSLAVRLGLPLFFLWRLWRLRDARLSSEALLCVGCAATSFDALVDYPFGRPETLLVFVASLALVERGLGAVHPTWSIEPSGRSWRAGAGALALFLAALLATLGSGLGARKLWFEKRNVSALRVALRFWPWDEQWNETHLQAFARANDTDSMERLAALRLRAWPHSAVSHLLQARVLEGQGDFAAAIRQFRRAVITAKNGRCYHPGYRAYQAMLERPDFPPSAPRLGPDDLEPCEKRTFRPRRTRSQRRPRRGPCRLSA